MVRRSLRRYPASVGPRDTPSERTVVVMPLAALTDGRESRGDKRGAVVGEKMGMESVVWCGVVWSGA